MTRRKLLQASAAGVIAAPFISEFFDSSALAASDPAPTQPTTQPIARFGDGRDWFFADRFGMFIHWGIYSIAGWHEQYQWRFPVPRDEYVKLAQQWNPVKFDPNAWLDLAQSAGMKYLTFTTKHHDGFCLWNTKETSY